MQKTAVFLTAAALTFATPMAARAGEARGTPNLLVDVSAALINTVVQQRVDRTEPFEDVVLDVPNYGMRRTVGNVWAELVPAPSHGVLDIRLNATTWAQGIGYRPHTRLWTSTIAPFDVRYRVVLDEHGFRGCRGPAFAGARIYLHNVTDRYGDNDSTAANFVRRGFYVDREEAETIVRGRTAWQTSLRQEAEVAPGLAKANESLTRGRDWAKKAGIKIEAFQVVTTATHVEARLRVVDGKPTISATPAIPADTDLGVRIHESFFNEAAKAALGGKTFGYHALKEIADTLTAPFFQPAEKAEKATGADALKLTMAKDDPVTVTFTAGGFTIEIHVAAIRAEDITLPGTRVRAHYRIDSSADGVHLVRKGPLEMLPADAKAKPLPAPLNLLLTPLAGAVLRERLTLQNLPTPVAFTPPAVTTGNGWLAVAWQLRKGQ